MGRSLFGAEGHWGGLMAGVVLAVFGVSASRWLPSSLCLVQYSQGVSNFLHLLL